MNTMSIRRFIGMAYDFLSKRAVYHSLFWISFLLLYVVVQELSSDRSLSFTLTNALITVFFYGLIVYFNILYLIPNFLSGKKFLRYCAILLVSVFVVAYLKIFVLYLRFYGDPVNQALIVERQEYLFLLTFMVAGVSTISKIITDWIRHQRERQVLQTQTMQSELKFLRSQINPHFLFNTLNNLYALTLKKSDKAPEIVIKLSEMMRYMLYECNEKRVPLIKEVNYLHNYLDLERLRQGKNVDIKIQVNGTVSGQMVAPLMFIPFVENSFKHGLSNQISQGFVNIELDVADKDLRLFIENSKPERLPIQEPKRSGGIGLVNVRRRLNLLYPDSHLLEIKDNPNTYAVELNLDLSK